MMENIESDAWLNAADEDLWIFDKLIVSRKLGYNCGPVGVSVPSKQQYIVRPCVNIPGMGRDAFFTEIEDDTEHLPSGYFWCEVFKGRHISVDYQNGVQFLAVEGFRNSPTDELWRFSKWEKVDDVIPLPSIFYSLTKRYKFINIEYIDGRAIEVHLRFNPDFVYGNSVAYPVWNDGICYTENKDDLKFVESKDFKREGFYIK